MYIRKTIQFDEDLESIIKAIADKQRRSFSNYVNKAVRSEVLKQLHKYPEIAERFKIGAGK